MGREIKEENREGMIKFIAYLDGDTLCVVREDFVNLQESPAVFVDLDKDIYDALRCIGIYNDDVEGE